MVPNIETLTETIDRFVRASVSAERYQHSVRVAQTAALLCGTYGLDRQTGYLAGIAHDMCKDMPGKALRQLAAKDGNALSALEDNKPSLLHGRAAAVMLSETYAVTDRAVLESVAYHTFGKPGMGALAKIVFVADKVEPGRPQSTETYRARLFALPLDGLTVAVLEENIAYLMKKGKQPAPFSLDFLASLKKGGADK